MPYKHSWTERCNYNKRRFKELYGRKPTKEEVKAIRKGLIDLKIPDNPELFIAGGERSIAEKISIKGMGNRGNADELYGV